MRILSKETRQWRSGWQALPRKLESSVNLQGSDSVQLDHMTAADHALRAAAADIPAEVSKRLDTPDKLSDEDRETIIQIARKSLTRFQPKPETEPEERSWATSRPVTVERLAEPRGDLQSVVRTLKATAAFGDEDRLIRHLGSHFC
jgi:hypothetical protein